VATCPDREKMPNPFDFPVPIAANQSGPFATISGTEARVSTLLITVGQAYSPATAGNGGLSRGRPRCPSSDVSCAVSSPHS